MQSDHETVLAGSFPRDRYRPGGHRPLLQTDMEIDHPLVAGGLGAAHALSHPDADVARTRPALDAPLI
jgi:hypothetical protein